MIKDKLQRLRENMKAKNIFAYVIPSADFHQSEYVGEYFKCRQFISGFTGSAGAVVVTLDEAGLWTDGRYFIQAEEQLKGSTIKLFKMGEEGVPTIEQYLNSVLKDGDTLAFDGRVMSAKEGYGYEKDYANKNINVVYEYDLIDAIWEDRPSMSEEKAFLLDVKYAGESSQDKLSKVRAIMKKQNSTIHILNSLYDIAWLFNIRGNDIKNTPVILSSAVITLDKVYFFIDENKLNDEIKEEFNKIGIEIRDYFEIYEFVKNINKDEVVLLDGTTVNYTIYKNIPSNVTIIDAPNPTFIFKAIKNEVELQNIRDCHIKDGVAMTKFMYWLKTNIGKMKITEISAADKLEELRRNDKECFDLSFPTIAGYKEHAAMMHYSATEESDYELKQEGMLLVDSGGQYYTGTTDITRTYILGDITEEQKLHYTSVLRGMIRLSKAKFLYGCRGLNLDILARGPLWDIGIDYKCGTGHGIGFVSNVHEGPNGFRWKIVPERNDSCIFEEGMVTTNEPGVYIEGSHGIRIENELICQRGPKVGVDQFMEFETITFAPIDLDGVNPEYMEKSEIAWLNNYHEQVFEKISPYLNEEEVEWLKKYTRAI